MFTQKLEINWNHSVAKTSTWLSLKINLAGPISEVPSSIIIVLIKYMAIIIFKVDKIDELIETLEIISVILNQSNLYIIFKFLATIVLGGYLTNGPLSSLLDGVLF